MMMADMYVVVKTSYVETPLSNTNINSCV